jgi:rhodanese-related sulfurtransferase
LDLPLETTPSDVKRKLEAGDPVHLIDVREPVEYQTARIEGAELIPMRTVPARLQEIENKAETGILVVYCHHGMRSLQVVSWLREQGIANCQSMAGGIDLWSALVDPKVPRY